ncbi:MAG: DUF4124 domain-containing protein [Pseudomonadota bacterium]|nr:DUF4124 domain-containing protein [Pseudomonadota bacterium]
MKGERDMITRLTIAFIGAFLLASGNGPVFAAGKMYKWVDANGNVHYGDRVPPENAEHRRSEINKHGRTVQVFEAKTQQSEAELAEQERVEAAAAERARKDAILLRTYASEAEIVDARQTRLRDLQVLVDYAQQQRAQILQKLADQKAQAVQYSQKDRDIPAYLEASMGKNRSELEATERYIATRKAEMKTNSERFGADLQRFRELQSGARAPGAMVSSEP